MSDGAAGMGVGAPAPAGARVAGGEPRPLVQADRLESLDVLRGLAVLGILAMNIMSFSGPAVGYADPTRWPIGYEGGNRVAYWVTHTLFDLKMMSLFSMLFGAGVIVWDAKGGGGSGRVGRLWLRRMFWLLVIGMAHAWLLWEGDILVAYALCGAMVAWWVRRLAARWLLLLAGALFVVHVALMGLQSMSVWMAFGEHGGRAPLGMPEASHREMREGMKAYFAPTAAMLVEELASFRGGYWQVLAARARVTIWMQTTGFAFMVFWRATSMMLLGMALTRMGVLTGHRSARLYATMAAAGYAIGLPMVIGGILDSEAHRDAVTGRFDVARTALVAGPLNVVGSLPVCLGHVGVVLLVVRLGWLRGVRRALAATGQMALTNYLSQTVICTTLFYGYGFGLYGRLDRAALMGIVGAIWALQLAWSPLWLSWFRFGPAEWVWRSLTYWRVQGLRRGGRRGPDGEPFGLHRPGGGSEGGPAGSGDLSPSGSSGGAGGG